MFCGGIVNVYQKEHWTYEGASRHTRKDSYKIRPLAIDQYALSPIFKEGFNPLQSVASNTIILQFIKKYVVRNLIKGLEQSSMMISVCLACELSTTSLQTQLAAINTT